MSAAFCALEGCNRPRRWKELCKGHGERRARHGDGFDKTPIGIRRFCAANDCADFKYARDWCKKHYGLWRNNGDANYVWVPARELIDWSGTRKCSDCAKDLPLTEYHKSKVGTPFKRCKACHYKINYDGSEAELTRRRMQSARAREKHYEKVRARTAAWQKANPQSQRTFTERPKALSPEALNAKLAYWGGKCWMCSGDFAHWDHVKPLSKGGNNFLSNLRPSCIRCNAQKSARWAGPENLDQFKKDRPNVPSRRASRS